jgi:predicted component of type VI protein secretion system
VVGRGPHAGAERTLAPPESMLVIGRGDEAGGVIVDADLSKRHAEIRRGWDGIRIVDLGSKNGTRVDGERVRDAVLHDGALVELGPLALRFRDPAERHLGGAAPARTPAPLRRSPVVFYAALAIMMLALAGMAWVLAS